MKKTLESEKNLRLVQAEITEILTENENGEARVSGVKTHLDEIWHAEKIIIATGTYLRSQIFVGDKVYEAGPDGMTSANLLTASLKNIGIKLLRFKTGTPARVHRRSIDFSRLELQEGERAPSPYSERTEKLDEKDVNLTPCHIVYTNSNTHKIILDNIKRSAMYSGNISGEGPRYCPSIETKLVRFADKERHQLFIEPCGLDTEEMYIQGFSTSMPTDVQYDMLHSLDGFENAEIMRYAYAIEYDLAEPTQMYPTLEFKSVKGLYGAGQFNGTSGYEEAGAQGLVAGINAARSVLKLSSLVLPRASSYIGTLIDDLVTKGTAEPYRMMTSRSEYRLILRQDNADERLTPIGYEMGLISEERYEKFLQKQLLIKKEVERCKKTSVVPSDELNSFLISNNSSPITTGIKLSELLKRPELSYDLLEKIDTGRPSLPKSIARGAEIRIKYEGYIKREYAEAEKQKRLENMQLSEKLDYSKILGLRKEAAEKLDMIKPLNIGQAARISGVNPADVSVLLIYLSQRKPGGI
jgi:tRNA uridine 5-carboxymethylaminomethyl modification enzyme